MPPFVTVVGYSESGKTTLMEKLIPELKDRGYRIGTIKHASHGFDLDRVGKDSWRHKKAGADTVILASPAQIAMVRENPRDDLEGLEPYLQDVDLVLVEGYKREKRPKIEIFRPECHPAPLFLEDPDLIALVTDAPLEVRVPKFASSDVRGLADLIEKTFLRKKR